MLCRKKTIAPLSELTLPEPPNVVKGSISLSQSKKSGIQLQASSSASANPHPQNKSKQLLPPFQGSLLGGVGIVEVAVGAVTAAVLIRGDIEPAHFGFLHAEYPAWVPRWVDSKKIKKGGRVSFCPGCTGLRARRRAAKRYKKEGGVRTAAPGLPLPPAPPSRAEAGSRDAEGRGLAAQLSAADSSPARRVEKYQRARGAGARGGAEKYRSKKEQSWAHRSAPRASAPEKPRPKPCALQSQVFF